MLFQNLDLPTLVAYVIVLVVSFSVHEFAHAWTADRLGDDTPRMYGRLTLNPLAHLDPIGTLMLLLAGFGWAKPVPVNSYALSRRSPSALMWVALAGPMSNFIMAILAAIPFRLGLLNLYNVGFVGEVVITFLVVNIALMLFNLIPIAPLDGDKIVDYLLPPNWASVWERIRPYGPMVLLALMIVGQFSGFSVWGALLGPPRQALLNLLLGL
jgi:Zn-dependent protease